MRGDWRGSKPRRHRNPRRGSKRRWRKFRWRPPRHRSWWPEQSKHARGEDGRPLRGRTLVQAGRGYPRGTTERIRSGWSVRLTPINGALHRARSARGGPVAHRGVGLLAWFFIRLARPASACVCDYLDSRGPAAQWAPCCSRASPRPSRRASPVHAIQHCLNELRDRLLAAPHCAPTVPRSCRRKSTSTGSDADRPESERVGAPGSGRTVRRGSLANRFGGRRRCVESRVAVSPTMRCGCRFRAARTIRIEGRVVGDSVHLAFPLAPRSDLGRCGGWDCLRG